jgi:hypothetical protein
VGIALQERLAKLARAVVVRDCDRAWTGDTSLPA